MKLDWWDLPVYVRRSSWKGRYTGIGELTWMSSKTLTDSHPNNHTAQLEEKTKRVHFGAVVEVRCVKNSSK